jgi:aminoglycoside phosphotransferase (APT) family kinase protein
MSAALADRLERSLGAHHARTRLRSLAPLPGGISSETFAAELEGPGAPAARIVVKVAPAGLPAKGSRDVLRQARVMRALAGVAGVRVPAVLFEDDREPPFFAMPFVAGDSYEPKLETVADPPAPAEITARARAAAAMLAAIGAVERATVDPDGGERVLTPADELARWRRLFATCRAEHREGEEELHERLAAGVPDPDPRPRLQHGDYRLANLLCREGRVEAIIDWELWSLGDFRCDVAWLLMHTDPVHRLSGPPDEANRRAAAGMPSAAELLAAYREAGGEDPGPLGWFAALGHYKSAAAVAALAKRSDGGGERVAFAVATLPALIERGLELVADVAPRPAPQPTGGR